MKLNAGSGVASFPKRNGCTLEGTGVKIPPFRDEDVSPKLSIILLLMPNPQSLSTGRDGINCPVRRSEDCFPPRADMGEVAEVAVDETFVLVGVVTVDVFVDALVDAPVDALDATVVGVASIEPLVFVVLAVGVSLTAPFPVRSISVGLRNVGESGGLAPSSLNCCVLDVTAFCHAEHFFSFARVLRFRLAWCMAV